MKNKKTKLIISERNKDYYMKLWGIDENKSYTQPHRFVKQPALDSYLPSKITKLKDWNWKQNFKTLEDATEFLLSYCKELGPLAEECLHRLNKNAEIIRQLTITNKHLRGGIITNDRFKQNRN